MKRTYYLFFILSAALGFWWAIQRNCEVQFRARIARMGEDDFMLARLRREHERLQALLNGSGPQSAAAPDSEGLESRRKPGAMPGESPSMGTGVWAAPGDWKSCGNATPNATIESVLYAAAHGDLNLLRTKLEFDEAVIEKAKSILAELPESTRRQYAGPEDLLTTIVGGSIPLDSAQLVARQENGPDDVTEYVRLKDSDGATRQVCMSLHQSSDGWRLSIPANVVDRIQGP